MYNAFLHFAAVPYLQHQTRGWFDNSLFVGKEVLQNASLLGQNKSR